MIFECQKLRLRSHLWSVYKLCEYRKVETERKEAVLAASKRLGQNKAWICAVRISQEIQGAEVKLGRPHCHVCRERKNTSLTSGALDKNPLECRELPEGGAPKSPHRKRG